VSTADINCEYDRNMQVRATARVYSCCVTVDAADTDSLPLSCMQYELIHGILTHN